MYISPEDLARVHQSELLEEACRARAARHADPELRHRRTRRFRRFADDQT